MVIMVYLSAVYERIKEFTLQDSLTGLYRRGVFISSLVEILRKACLSGEDVFLFVIDVDYFKKINDQRGHVIGDDALVTLGQILKLCVRSTDYVGRYGGDEFVVVLKGLPEEGIPALAERLRKAVEDHFAGGLDLTISVGVSSALRGAREAEELLNLADAALYKAKSEGRNRIVFA
jgi:diguanylate cyclase (GGDEF)-like protein